MFPPNNRTTRAIAWASIALIPATSAAFANINLELRPVSQIVPLGSTVTVGLYAVSDDPEVGQLMAAADVMLGWDAAVLRLLGVDNTGSPLLSSGFPVNDPYNVNEVVPPQDGDGYYQALAFLGTPLQATTAGTLLTTLRFEALSATSGTSVDILASAGNPAGQTIVFDGLIPGLNTTGTLAGATVTVSECSCFADLNNDGLINGADAQELIDCLVATGPNCACADVHPDGVLDLADVTEFVAGLLAGTTCP